VLWAELTEFDIIINYAHPASKSVVRPAFLSYAIDKANRSQASIWIQHLLDRAYGKARLQKRIKVLVNPYSGKGGAEKWYLRDVEPILAAARCEIDMEKTRYQGHATDIVEKLDIDAYDVVAACSGDGLPYEIFNGLGKRADARKALAKIAVAHIPCGSGNAMSHNLSGTDSPSLAALCLVKGLPTPLDLISVTQGDKRTLSFLSQSIGIVAETDLGTEHLRWMGAARFTYGFLVKLLGKTVYPCDIAVKVSINDKPSIREHYKKEFHNQATISERRFDTLGEEADVTTEASNGLPPLKFGTVNDDLPDGWEMIPYDKLGNFYAGNVGTENVAEWKKKKRANDNPDGIHGRGCKFLPCRITQ
jgi:sphingosine kinase